MSWTLSRAIAPEVLVVDQTDSTNADLKARVASGEHLDHLTTLITRDQRVGRGRLDRRWIAPRGTALAISTVVRVPHTKPERRGWLPLIAGSAMATACAAQFGEAATVGVKWPNDVLVSSPGAPARKLSGILVEGTSDPDAVVVGWGVNTSLRAEAAPTDTATSFAMLGTECDEDQLVHDLLFTLRAGIAALEEHRGDAAQAREHALWWSSSVGADVRVRVPDGSTISGRAADIDADGRLVLETASGSRAIAAGDVVHASTGSA